MKVKALCIFISLAIILGGCALVMYFMKIETMTEIENVTLMSIDDVPVENWKKLAEIKIFFGHQSVGFNIVDGISEILNERDDIKLNIVQTSDPVEFDRPVFAHSQVGRNTDPVSKIKSFETIVDAGIGDKVDIAFFKFCYVDIMRDSDPYSIFNSYKILMDELKTRYPETAFLHLTVPLCSAPKGIKRSIKQSVKLLIGKPGILDDNAMRQSYNSLLTEAYCQTGLVFELALMESVNPEGFRCYAEKGEEKVFVLVPEYTDDGGHLNSTGRKKVAEQLLIKLAEIASSI